MASKSQKPKPPKTPHLVVRVPPLQPCPHCKERKGFRQYNQRKTNWGVVRYMRCKHCGKNVNLDCYKAAAQ
jgi:DNA-directed RNA polymerase subunit M/transcription elongation factor TFIIS